LKGIELHRQRAGDAARRSAPVAFAFVVVRSPGRHGHPGLMQGFKPALVEVLVAELAVEALDVTVLHGAPRLDQDVADAVGLGPGHECPAGELRTIVGSHGLWIPAKQRGAVQHPAHVLP